MTFL
jgi:hypothetical protein